MSKVFEDARLYRKNEARQPLGLSDRAFDVWLARQGVKRVVLSPRSIRYQGVDLNNALQRAQASA